MVLPQSFTGYLLVAIVSLILGTVWALAPKAAGKWRFELFGIDFGIGVVLGALLIGSTFGSMGGDITFYDNLMIMRKSSLAFLIGAGALLNLGMLLLLGAVSLAGVAVAFLAGMTMAAVSTAVGMHLVQPLVSPLYLGAGCVLLLAALVLAAKAHAARVRQRDTDLLQKAVAAGIKGKIPRSSPGKGIALAVIGGLLVGLAQPIAIYLQSRDEIGFGPYSMGALFAAAFLVGTPFFALFFLNLPVQGEALSFGAWFKGTAAQHLMGLASGIAWYAGFVSLLVTATAPAGLGLGRPLAFASCFGVILVGGGLGLFVNKEFAAYAGPRGQATMALLAAAAGLAAFAAGHV